MKDQQRPIPSPTPVGAPSGYDRARCRRQYGITQLTGIDTGMRLITLRSIEVFPASVKGSYSRTCSMISRHQTCFFRSITFEGKGLHLHRSLDRAASGRHEDKKNREVERLEL